MKARIKHTNDPFQEIEGVKLGYVIYQPDSVEFEIEEKEHSIDWEQVRIHAAIAAMQGLLANPQLFYGNGEEKIDMEAMAMSHVDELVRRLKGE